MGQASRFSLLIKCLLQGTHVKQYELGGRINEHIDMTKRTAVFNPQMHSTFVIGFADPLLHFYLLSFIWIPPAVIFLHLYGRRDYADYFFVIDWKENFTVESLIIKKNKREAMNPLH